MSLASSDRHSNSVHNCYFLTLDTRASSVGRPLDLCPKPSFTTTALSLSCQHLENFWREIKPSNLIPGRNFDCCWMRLMLNIVWKICGYRVRPNWLCNNPAHSNFHFIKWLTTRNLWSGFPAMVAGWIEEDLEWYYRRLFTVDLQKARAYYGFHAYYELIRELWNLRRIQGRRGKGLGSFMDISKKIERRPYQRKEMVISGLDR